MHLDVELTKDEWHWLFFALGGAASRLAAEGDISESYWSLLNKLVQAAEKDDAIQTS
jgi:hypothetical protein